MSILLHLETATPVCSVGISIHGELKALREITDQGFSHGEQLTLLIQQCLDDCSLKASDLNAVCVTSGPGSYTGLRIGVSTAKGLCYALQIPLIAVDALSALIEQVRTTEPTATICAMIDARRKEVFSLIQGADGTVVKPISADVLDETSYAAFEPFIVVGDGAPKMKEEWQGRHIVFREDVYASVKGQVKLAFERFQQKKFEDVAYFEPFYLKEFYTGK